MSKAGTKSKKSASEKSYASLRAGLDDGAKAPRRKTRKPTSAQAAIEAVEATLLELVNEGTSDQARVAAAKALMDLMKYMHGDADTAAHKAEADARAASIEQASALLAEFAALKLTTLEESGIETGATRTEPSADTVSGGDAGAAALAETGAATATDADAS